MSEFYMGPPDPEMRNAAALAGAHGVNRNQYGWLAETEVTPALLARQALHLRVAYGLPVSTAGAVAALAWGTGR